VAQPVKERYLTADQVAQLVYNTVRPLVERVTKLEDCCLKSAGLYTSGKAYAVNDVTTYDGSLWQCTMAHVSGASFSHDCWRLVVKHGRDGKDLRAKPHDHR